MTLPQLGFCLSKPFLQALDAEQAHRLTIKALQTLPRRLAMAPAASLRQRLFGLDFPNPLGLAPGFDKNAEVPDAMLALGFGFVEVGTVTPKPQQGNPKPRLFRLPADQAVINRMGFNNDGADVVYRRLAARRHMPGLVAVNIGANKDSADRIADYCAGVRHFGPLAQALTINISSPNTPGLRALQSRDELQRLLDAITSERAHLSRAVPLFLKIAPDLIDSELADIAACCRGGAVDAVIISNTTLSRPGLISPHAGEAGGLSGRPLFAMATRQLAKFHVLTEGRIPLIGVGGIDSPETAWAKIEAGASLIQLYSALVYQGPALIQRILSGLAARLAAEGLESLTPVVGRRAAEMTAAPPA